MHIKKSIDSLLNKKGCAGTETGKALLSSIIHDIRHQGEPDFKPLFSQSEFNKMESHLNTEQDYLAYEMYRDLYNELLEIFNTESGHSVFLDDGTEKRVVKPSVVPSDTQKTGSFTAMLNGAATNHLTNINTRTHQPILDELTGDFAIKQGAFKIFIDNYNKLTGGLRTSTHKLLDICTIALTQQNSYRGKEEKINPFVVIPLERYMELCGIPPTKPSKDKARLKIKEDLNTLYHISMEWEEQSGRKTKSFAKMRLCDKVGINKGNIIFSFSHDMAKYLTNAYLMQYPMELLKVDERNPSSYHIGKKLLLHNSIDNNKRKGTSNILSVKSLLEVCPEIPSYNSVLLTDRAIDRRIKVPLETALNNLPFVRWEYCNSKGVVLTKEQLDATDYNTLVSLFIKFDIIGEIDQTARLNARAEDAKARAKANGKRSPKNKK